MILNKLSIINYKNITQADLVFSPKINCFVGGNGEGKTNILDAIYFLSLTKSATGTLDSLNIKHNETTMMLSANYDVNGNEENISGSIQIKQKKIFRRNQKAYKRLSEHIGLLPLVLVSPSDSILILGGSEERRRFMDLVISQYTPAYMEWLSHYNKALQQRNALLKQDDSAPPIEILDAYEQMMASYGELIYHERDKYIRELVPIFQKYYNRISGNREPVHLQYVSHGARGPLYETIRAGRNRDLAVGYSLHGIHKDDLEMTLGGYNIRKEASQGQSKTYLISLKLAQLDFLEHTGSNTRPILLLDDIFDKLDSQRVKNIIDMVGKNDFGQIFITDTNREHMDHILAHHADDYKLFHVKSGNITPL